MLQKEKNKVHLDVFLNSSFDSKCLEQISKCTSMPLVASDISVRFQSFGNYFNFKIVSITIVPTE